MQRVYSMPVSHAMITLLNWVTHWCWNLPYTLSFILYLLSGRSQRWLSSITSLSKLQNKCLFSNSEIIFRFQISIPTNFNTTCYFIFKKFKCWQNSRRKSRAVSYRLSNGWTTWCQTCAFIARGMRIWYSWNSVGIYRCFVSKINSGQTIRKPYGFSYTPVVVILSIKPYWPRQNRITWQVCHRQSQSNRRSRESKECGNKSNLTHFNEIYFFLWNTIKSII